MCCGSAEVDIMKEYASWVFPLIVTIIFAVISAITANRQKKLMEWQVGISLMEKRLDTFCKERKVLEGIIDYRKPNAEQLADLCHADLEAGFLFEEDVCNHLKTVLELAQKSSEYTKQTMPDGYGGYDAELHDLEEEAFSQQAVELLGEAIKLYKRYVDFSVIGVIKTGEKDEKRS